MKKLILSIVSILFLGSITVLANNQPPTARITTTPDKTWFYDEEQIIFSGVTSSDNDEGGSYINYYWWYVNGSLKKSGSSASTYTICFERGVTGTTSNGCIGIGSATSVQIKLKVRDDENTTNTKTINYDILTNNRRYFVKDHLGSIRTTVDESGTAIGYDDYYPFGKVIAGRSNNTSNPNDNYKFTGQERDTEAGLMLDYMNARTYDPILGRFNQVDPLFDDPAQAGLSPYNYSWNNPTNLTDPTGECPWCLAAIKGAVQEYGTQVAVNLIQGKSLSESLTDVSVKDIAIAAATDGLTLGLGSLAKGARTVDRIADATRAADAADDASDASRAITKIDDIDTDEVGVIYKVAGDNTSTGKPYIGSSDDFNTRQNFAGDGRNRQGAEIVDTYPLGDRDARRVAEQNAINREVKNQGGVDIDVLDNKRNEIAETKWKQKGVKQ